MKFFLIVLFLLGGVFGGCRQDFLDTKPNSSIVVPTNLAELRGLLDNEEVFSPSPLLGTQSADEYYFAYSNWQAMRAKERNAYVWAADIYEDNNTVVNDWNKPYEQIFYANVALEGLAKAKVSYEGETQEKRAIEGTAYFLRARAFHMLAEVFALPYDARTAKGLEGIPLKLSADINEPIRRPTLDETYRQIIADLSKAGNLLTGLELPINKIRPNKLAVYALSARIYLSMSDYELAGLYADSALSAYGTLMDYNAISPTALSPFQVNNIETIFQSRVIGGIRDFTTTSGSLHIDSSLFALYGPGDLRKDLYFRMVGDRRTMKSTYSGLIQFFSGLATDELYLIRAECLVRQGRVADGLGYLNALLAKRCSPERFTVRDTTDPEEALDWVLEERRKELIFRGVRWSDIRRLNLGGRGITLKRALDGDTVMLPPHDSRYALPIPPQEIDRSGIEQNVR